MFYEFLSLKFELLNCFCCPYMHDVLFYICLCVGLCLNILFISKKRTTMNYWIVGRMHNMFNSILGIYAFWRKTAQWVCLKENTHTFCVFLFVCCCFCLLKNNMITSIWKFIDWFILKNNKIQIHMNCTYSDHVFKISFPPFPSLPLTPTTGATQ